MERLWTKSYILMIIGMFFLFTAFYMLYPTLPLFIKERGGNESQVGLEMGAFMLSSVTFRPFVGGLLDRFGRRPFIVWGLLFFAVAMYMYNWIGGIVVLMFRSNHFRNYVRYWFRFRTTCSSSRNPTSCQLRTYRCSQCFIFYWCRPRNRARCYYVRLGFSILEFPCFVHGQCRVSHVFPLDVHFFCETFVEKQRPWPSEHWFSSFQIRLT